MIGQEKAESCFFEIYALLPRLLGFIMGFYPLSGVEPTVFVRVSQVEANGRKQNGGHKTSSPPC